MAERLCGGRVVSVLERRCLAAAQVAIGDEATNDPLSKTMERVGGGLESSRRPTGGSKGKGKGKMVGSDMTETEEDYDQGDIEAKVGGEEGKTQETLLSEVDCLEGHIRGLREGL